MDVAVNVIGMREAGTDKRIESTRIMRNYQTCDGATITGYLYLRLGIISRPTRGFHVQSPHGGAREIYFFDAAFVNYYLNEEP